MAGKKKFGAFAGVFTPSLLTILGVIMYMRMGWVVGNAGLIGTLAIIVIAHVISISTGLSVSSIATDKKVGAGGIYYILSRSMGIPIGGAIGITLYIGTAFSIALYLIGFAESLNGYFGLDTGINGLRISGSVALIVLTAIALISTSVAIKTQFFILAAIALSLASIFFGTHDFAPESIALFTHEGSVSLEIVFAIFFPAVTGFTAGIAMSGDLKNPKKDIPIGTISAITVGFFVYIGLAIFLATYVDSETLSSDYNILMKIALFAPAVVAGIWGATLSSALGGVLGGPRILQAMSLDRITPRVFGKGKGKNNEPVNALLLVFIIAFSGILIGELDIIARIVSMFYLAAYGVINLSFFLENWANPDFQPTFKVKRWIGLVGFVASFAVMFKLDMLAMFGSIVIILGIFFWLQRKQIALESSDVWQSVWQNIVAKGLKKLDAKESDVVNWNPNIILFSGKSAHRSYLVELCNTISGRTGIVTNFNLILDKNSKNTLSKADQIVKDEEFEKLGVFARQVKVDNIFKGIENIASTFGFSGVEPNTIMMGWPRELSNSSDYATMTQKLLLLDYNLLYLDFDKKKKFGNYQTVDLWWRETDSKNAEMMLNIARFVLQSPRWSNVNIRVLFVNHNNIDNQVIKSKIAKLVKDLRVNVEIKIINNGVEQTPFYDIIALQSVNTDLTLVGIPNIQIEKQAEFIVNTNHLFETIGSTLMVKASNNFNELELNLSQESIVIDDNKVELKPLPAIDDTILSEQVLELDTHLLASLSELSQPALTSIASFYTQFVEDLNDEFAILTSKLAAIDRSAEAIPLLQSFVDKLGELSVLFRQNKLDAASEVLEKGIVTMVTSRAEFLKQAPRTLKISSSKKLRWRYILKYYFSARITPNTQQILYDFGAKSFVLLNAISEGIAIQSNLFIENFSAGNPSSLAVFDESIKQLILNQKENVLKLKNNALTALQNFDRNICVELLENFEDPMYFTDIRKAYKRMQKHELLKYKRDIVDFANNWLRNQVLSHRQAETGWHLLHSALGLAGINETIKAHLDDSLLHPQHKKLEVLSNAAEALSKNGNKGIETTTINAVNQLASGTSHVNFTNLFEEEEKKIIGISQDALKTVELMSPESFNLLFKEQGDAVDTIPVNLFSIQNHVIQSDYLAPLQDILQTLEESYNQNSEDIYNSANHISQLINELKKDQTRKENAVLIKEEQENIENHVVALNKLADSFSLDLSTNLRQAQDNLDIRTIINSEELLSKASHKPVIRSRFHEWKSHKADALKHRRSRIVDFINKHRQEIDTLKFDELHNTYFNKIEQSRAFIDSHKIDPSVSEVLPFYYKKLFTGSHLAGAGNARNAEFSSAIKTLDIIKSGTSGAIMIIGDSLSGKTYFSENLAKTLTGLEKYDVNPPENQSYTSNDLHDAFRKIFDKKGTSFTILNQLKKSRVFIFNDIERWWTRSKNGSICLDYLAELIEKVGSKHFFILNCNKYSYQIIKETSALEKKLLATIIIRPASSHELKNIVFNRHKIGGAEVYYRKDLVGESNRIKELINEIHGQSSGNVGVALHLWLTSISMTDGKELHIGKPKVQPFPSINHPEWKLLLYHFMLHRKLSEQQLQEIFVEDALRTKSSLIEMEKSGLVFKQPDGNYQLNFVARFYIEKWLKTLSFLN
jgi:amino acid transporter